MATLDRLPFIAPGTPTLDLNFAAGQVLIRDVLGAPARPAALDTLLTISRTSPAWMFGPDGNLGRVDAGVLRYAFDPVTRAPRGLLLEGASANLALQSNSFTTAAYTKADLTLFAFATQGIDGRNTATRVVDTATGGTVGKLSQTVPIQFPVLHSGGFFVRPVTGTTQVRLRAELLGGSSTLVGDATFDLATGAVLTSTGVAARCRPGPGGFWRPEVAIGNSVGATSLRLTLERAIASDTGVSYDVAEAQIEARYPLSSPIPTTSAVVTRAADRLSMSIGPWWVPTEATITAEFTPMGDSVGSSQNVLVLRNDAANAFIQMQRTQFGAGVAIGSSGGAYALMYGADNDLDRRVAFRVRDGDYAGAMSGNTYLDGNVAVSAGSVPQGLTTLDIGHFNGGGVLDGLLRRIVVETRAQANTPLSNRVR